MESITLLGFEISMKLKKAVLKKSCKIIRVLQGFNLVYDCPKKLSKI